MNTEPTLRKLPLLALAGVTVLGAVACQNPYLGYPPPPPGGNVFMSQPPNPQQPDRGQNRFGHNGTQSPNRKPSGEKIRRDPTDEVVDVDPPPPKRETVRDDTPVDPPVETPDKPKMTDTASTPTSTSGGSTTQPKPAAPKEDLPFGSKVIGKPGMVYSPYAPDKGWVDVDGLRPGTKVKCPYTGKNFRVP